MKLSIIIPMYNAENYIIRCLSSIEIDLKNNPEYYELILVNDGSIDSTENVVKDYISKNSDIDILYLFTENKGVSHARNLGLRNVKGDYVYFLDSDDYVSDNFLSSILDEIFVSSPDLIVTSYKRFKNSTSVLFINDHRSHECFFTDYIDDKYNVNMCTLVFRLDNIKRINLHFSEDLKYGEDLEFYQKYFTISPNISYIEDVFFFYIDNLSSAMNRKSGFDRFDAIEASLRVKKYLELNFPNLVDVYSKRYLPMRLIRVFKNLVDEESYEEAIVLCEKYKSLIHYGSLGIRSDFKLFLMSVYPYFIIKLLSLSTLFRSFLRVFRRQK